MTAQNKIGESSEFIGSVIHELISHIELLVEIFLSVLDFVIPYIA